MSNISSNSFLSDLSNALRNDFQSAFDIASTFLNDDGIVLPILYASNTRYHIVATIPIPINDGKDTTDRDIINTAALSPDKVIEVMYFINETIVVTSCIWKDKQLVDLFI